MKLSFLLPLFALLTARIDATSISNDESPRDANSRFAPGELLVKWKDGPASDAATMGNRAVGANVIRNFPHIGWQLVQLPDGMSVEEGLHVFRQLGMVSAVELNLNYLPGRDHAMTADASIETGSAPQQVTEAAVDSAPLGDRTESSQPKPTKPTLALQSLPPPASSLVTPNDPQYKNQWNLTKIGAPQAWSATTGSTNVVVAIVDSGIDYVHPDLAPNMWRNPGETGLDAQGREKATNGIDDDGNGYIDDVYGINVTRHNGNPMDGGDFIGHGTGLAGIIGAVGNNEKGIAGINWNVNLMAVAIQKATVAEFLEAVDYIIMMKKRGVNVRVISNSLFNEGRHPLADAVNAAGEVDILTVFDADNTGYNNDVFFGDSPKTQWTIVIGGSSRSDALVSYSGYGHSTVDLAAPTEVPSTTVRSAGSYVPSFSGTSAAQPHGAGAAALLAAAKPDATALEIKAALKQGVDQVPALKNKTATGGRLNLAGSLQALTNVDLPPIVLGVIPVSNQTRPDDMIEVLFNRPMDRASVEAAFQITPAVKGTFAWSNGDRALQFLHSEPFSKELFTTNYTCTILGSAQDTTGRKLDGNFNRTSEGSPTDDFFWTFSLPLANDDFADAFPISGAEGNIAGTTRYALPQFPDEPVVTESQPWGLSVWYRWTPNATGWATFDLTLSNKFDTALMVLSGSRLDQLSIVATNDNNGTQKGSRASFAAVEGNSYFIKVAGKWPGFFSDAMWGTFLLRWYPTSAPGFTDTEFAPSSGLPGATISLTGTNFTGATAVLFNGVSATFTNATGNNLDLTIAAVVPPNAASGSITVVTPHGTVTSTSTFSVTFPEVPPVLTARALGNGQIELAWPGGAVGFELEATDVIGTAANWNAITSQSAIVSGPQHLKLEALSATRYFRLHKR